MSAIGDRDDLSDVLEHLHWTVGDYRRQVMATGDRHRERGRSARFQFVAQGSVRIGGDISVQLGASDFLLLPRGGDHTVVAEGATVLHTGGLRSASPAADRVVAAMPSVVVACCLVSREPVVATLIESMASEATAGRPGSRSVMSQLASVVAAAAIRSWVERGCGTTDLLSVPLRDSDIGRAMTAIHDSPGTPWTVEQLARIALVSRSAFAKRFRLLVGDSPANYVTRVRMEQAKRLLAEQTAVAEVALRLGYGSQAAFSRAFRRHAGAPPARWRHTGAATVTVDVR